MKNLILITILILTFITGDSYSQSYFGKSLFKDRIQANNVLYVTSLAQGTNEHATIASALSAYQTGMVIILAPEYFDEDVTISIDNVHIQGLSKGLSKIKSLLISAKDVVIDNITINGSTTITTQGVWIYEQENKNLLDNCIFLGDFYLGTPSIELGYPTHITNSKFIHTSKLIYFNASAYGHRFENCGINALDGNKTKVVMKSGDIRFIGNKNYIGIDTLQYINTNKLAGLLFINVDRVYIGSVITMTNNTDFAALVFRNSFAQWGSAFTFNGKFELVVESSRIQMTYNLVFNSTANSRLQGFHQYGYQSNATISGTGLNVLRVYNSIFRMSAPSGLGANVGNVWNAFIDN